jgi:hypothetical protein
MSKRAEQQTVYSFKDIIGSEAVPISNGTFSINSEKPTHLLIPIHHARQLLGELYVDELLKKSVITISVKS